MYRSDHRGGFTLFEMLVVLTIMGMLAALVAPLLVSSVRKAEARSEWVALNRVLSREQFEAWLGHCSATVRHEGASWRVRRCNGDERTVRFEHLRVAKAGTIRIDEHGHSEPSVVYVLLLERELELRLSRLGHTIDGA